jgi:hypothetical protein
MENANPYLVLTLTILLPLVPAYVLYRNLPGKAIVSGPLKGFNIKLSGAFGGYFALVVLVLSTLHLWNPVTQEEWTVTGKVQYEQGDTATLQKGTVIYLQPPPVADENPDGTFALVFKRAQGLNKNTLPNLRIRVPGYEFKSVPLSGEYEPYETERYKISIHGKHIVVEDPIKLIKKPSEPSSTGTPGPSANNTEHTPPAGGPAQ